MGQLFILMLSVWVLVPVILLTHCFPSDQNIETAVSRKQQNASNKRIATIAGWQHQWERDSSDNCQQ
jgi:hypothetical protein